MRVGGPHSTSNTGSSICGLARFLLAVAFPSMAASSSLLFSAGGRWGTTRHGRGWAYTRRAHQHSSYISLASAALQGYAPSCKGSSEISFIQVCHRKGHYSTILLSVFWVITAPPVCLIHPSFCSFRRFWCQGHDW